MNKIWILPFQVCSKHTHAHTHKHKQDSCLPWWVSTGLFDTAEVTVVSVLPVVDLASGEPPPSLELISCSGRRVSVDCRAHTQTHTHTHTHTHTKCLVRWHSLCGGSEGKRYGVIHTYSNALIVLKVHSILVFCSNQINKDQNLNIPGLHP